MPSSKRKPRRKAADLQETSEVDLPESSPAQRSAKKRKVNGERANTRGKVNTLHNTVPALDDSGDESETVSQSDMVDSIISYLATSKEPVVAAQEYSNEKDQPAHMQKVSAYAKIAGRNWTFFVREQSVNIGRPPDTGKESAGRSVGASSPIATDVNEMFPVHIDLGPSKIISRHHASIYYDSEYPEGGGWHVRVNGRNGVKVNNILIKRGGSQQLKSGAILEIAGTQMMFVTPGDKAQIHPMFIDRAKALATGEEFGTSHAHPDQEENAQFTAVNTYAPVGNYQSLAPAPPNFKRTTTPPPSDLKHGRGVFDSKPTQSPIYNRGMMMESTHEIDYSRDAAKDLKPPYSYATMIAQAIFSSDEEKLTLSNIYAYIADRYAFYRHSNSGWQNSIRHNLSLNKAFQKVPRRTDEPGKGMKWQIAPEYRQEYWKKQARRGTNSSAPSSPASSKDVNPNFRGPNGQNLGYDTTMVNQFSAKDMSERPPPPALGQHMNFQPFPPHQPGFAPPLAPQQALTPQRRRTDTTTTMPDPDLDDSPLPHAHLRPTPGHHQPTYTLPSSAPPSHHSPTNPTLSSSYLDTPFPTHSHTAHNILTPAPLRQNPRLAPPSTLVAPSKFMPESSPAGPAGLFWKGAMMNLGGIGATPGNPPPPDLSPEKHDLDRDDRGVMSSSPPPMDGNNNNSPTRVRSSLGILSSSAPRKNHRENGMLSFTNGIVGGGAHAGSMNQPRVKGESSDVEHEDEEEEDDAVGGGFDLAKGFAPIGVKVRK